MYLLGKTLLFVVLCILPSLNAQQQSAAASAGGLPVKRVVLYKSGVGYFEHLGQVSNNQDVGILFTSAQLNDVLKSLTVIDLGGGHVTGVSYASAAPVERQLGELKLPMDEKATLTEFLRALRGARVEIRSGAAATVGRLLTVERKTRSGGGATLEVDYLSMITESGEVKTIELTPGFAFRLLDKNMTGKFGQYLDLVASSRESDVRKMVVSTAGAGDRSLFVSYISEVPVWKATYRIVLDEKGPARSLLQGWAIVDNTVGQDWENVELSLVAGAPQSFVQELSKPWYTRRPSVPIPEQMTGAPQMHESRVHVGSAGLSGKVTDASGAVIAGATVRAVDQAGALIGQSTTDGNGVYTLNSLPDGPARVEVSSPGFNNAVFQGVVVSAGQPARRDATLTVGAMAETMVVQADAPNLQTSAAQMGLSSRVLGSGRGMGSSGRSGIGSGSGVGGGFGGGVYRLPETPVNTTAQPLGDLFEYKLSQPVTIRKNQSALVPILSSKVAVDKVSLWNDSAGIARPRRALWLTNTSGMTLDAGSFSVIEDERFAGEGIFDSIRADEKRIVSYALDLAVTPGSTRDTQEQPITRVRIVKGTLVHTREMRETKTYTFRNEDSKPRTLLVEHPVRTGWDLRSDVKPVETSAGWMRFRLTVNPKQTALLKVEEGKPLESSYAITNLTASQVAAFVSQRTINPAIEEQLRRVVSRKAAVQAIADKASDLEKEKGSIYDDQQRVRENMKSLKGSAEERALVQRYTAQLNQQETRLQDLTAGIAKLAADEAAAEEELEKLIGSLSFDAPL